MRRSIHSCMRVVPSCMQAGTSRGLNSKQVMKSHAQSAQRFIRNSYIIKDELNVYMLLWCAVFVWPFRRHCSSDYLYPLSVLKKSNLGDDQAGTSKSASCILYWMKNAKQYVCKQGFKHIHMSRNFKESKSELCTYSISRHVNN